MSDKNWSSEDSKEPSPSLERKLPENNLSTSSEKNKSKFSLFKKNVKKNFTMSSQDKNPENISDITSGKKKKIKKIKEKSKTLAKQPASTEQEPSTSEKKSKGSVVRKLSLDKLYSNIKGSSKSKDESLKGRRSTTPEVSSVPMSLKEELQEAESKLEGLSIPKRQDEESELSEDYRTPICQSPVGSYISEATSDSIPDPNSELSRENLSEISSTVDKKTEFFSSSEPSLESAVQSGTTTPRSDVDPKNKDSNISKGISYANILNKSDGLSSSTDEKESEAEAKISKTLQSSEDQSDSQNLSVSPSYSVEVSSTPSASDENYRSENTNNPSEDIPRETSLPSLLSNEELPKELQENKKTEAESFISEETPKDISEKDALLAESILKKRKSYLATEPETQASSDKRECLFKILVIGELGTGKTSIIKRYVHEFFSQHYRATIGVDFALKVLNWDQDTVIRLQLWDIAGQERFGNMTRVYYKEAVGAFIVFDVTRSATFDAVLKWKQDLDSKVQLPNGSPIPCVLLANKCDQPKEGPVNNPEKIEQFCRENNFSDWFETSAKENINIDQAAKCLVTKILQNDKLSQNGKESSRDTSKFPLDGKDKGSSHEKSCAC